MNDIIIDIETCPNKLNDEYFALPEKEKLGMINPIDSRIVAIGMRNNDTNTIFNILYDTEKEILTAFWNIVSNGSVRMVGFNIVDFDLPFIVSRSFINDVKICPINLKNDVIDIRNLINCHKYGHVRGKLKEYANEIGLTILETTGNDVARLVQDENWTDLNAYLSRDIEITDELYKRCKRLNLTEIKRW